MPEEFDPAWEYFVPDPEVAEAVSHATQGFDGLGIEDRRLDRDGAVSGFRFGRGRPDAFVCRLAPERPVERVGVANRLCGGCGRPFAPDRTSRKYCSDECYARPGRPRERPESAACEKCGRVFNPKRSEQRFCGRKCGGGNGTPPPRAITPAGEAVVAEMWAAGRTLAEIASHFGVTEITIKRTRRRLGLPARPVGNHAANRNPPMRETLPDRRRSWTQKAKIPDFAGKPQTFYLTCGEYADGRLGEVWVEAQKENTFTRGVLGAMARSASAALQNGTPVSEIVKMFRSLSFPPSGPVTAPGSDVRMCTSVADWVAQEIENVYVTGVSARPVTGRRGNGHGGGAGGVGGESGEPGAETA